MPAEERPTLEQAEGALRQLLADHQAEQQDTAVPTETPEAEPTAEPEAEPEQPATEPEPEEVVEAPAEELPDDVASLKKRLEDAESARKKDKEEFEAQVRAVSERGKTNEQILRDRALRKASVADRARVILEKIRSESGATESEIDALLNEIRGTMNPASPSYAPPPLPQPVQEEHVITMNDFLNEMGMTDQTAKEFGKWISEEGAKVLKPQEQAIAEQSLSGFLRIAHSRWQQSQAEAKKVTLNDAVEAVKVVQRTQKAAARATAATPRAPTKPTSPAPPKQEKLSKDDVSALLRQLTLEGPR